MKCLLSLPVFIFLMSGIVDADAIYLKDGKEIKGVVVEDYHDRITVSTERGEAPVLKRDIEDINYDATEANLIKLADLYRDKGDYKGALYYYEEAHRLNPDMKEASEGVLLMGSLVFRKKESDLEEQILLKQDTEKKMGRAEAETAPSFVLGARAERLKVEAGISISIKDSVVIVSDVAAKSPAFEAGVRQGDQIISVWGRFVKYMPLKEVYNLFLEGKVGEIRVTISREVPVTLKKTGLLGGAEEMLGGRFLTEPAGLTVSHVSADGALKKAGAIKGDTVSKIMGSPTRYMPLESAYKLIEGTNAGIVKLEVQREVVFWKR